MKGATFLELSTMYFGTFDALAPPIPLAPPRTPNRPRAVARIRNISIIPAGRKVVVPMDTKESMMKLEKLPPYMVWIGSPNPVNAFVSQRIFSCHK